MDSADSSASPPLHDVAVIDVGSNSVRLVLYRVDGRAIWTTYNEKVLAGLGRGLSRTRRLSPEGVEEALAALRRFAAVVEGAASRTVLTAATAAVREAEDGADFTDRAERETGLRLRVLSGEEEARISALGVAAGQAEADGVVGDLGGSSLELVRLHEGEPRRGVSLPLGPLALGAGAKGGRFDAANVRREITRRLEPAGVHGHSRLFAVGGAWRNLALLHMSLTGYPLRVVQQYEVPAAEMLETAQALVRDPRLALERIPDVSRRRSETLPYAALVLEGVIGRLGVEHVTLSAHGLREGLIFDRMAPQTRALDPLLEGCAALGGRQGLSGGLGGALEAWLTLFWNALPSASGLASARRRLLMRAACRLADLGAALHPDHRALLTFEQVLRAPMSGWTHAERGYLAQAVLSRYGGEGPPEPLLMARIVPAGAQAEARALGAALRLGCDLCGRTPALLAETRLEVEKGWVLLSPLSTRRDLLAGEAVRKRLAGLGHAVGLEARIAQ